MNFVIYLNNLKKEMSEISAEDLQEYKEIEWQKAYSAWGVPDMSFGRDTEKLLRVRDIFGYSSIDYPITDEEVKLNRKVYKDKFEAIMLKVGSKIDSEEVLSPEEQEFYKKELENVLKKKHESRVVQFWFIMFGLIGTLWMLAFFMYG